MSFTLLLVLNRLWNLIAAPFKYPDMLWIVLPLILTLVAIELYFGKYADENLGWNTALTNTLVLVFVSLNLFQKVFNQSRGFWKAFSAQGFYIALFVVLLGLVLFLIDFMHLLPDKIAMAISSHLPMNLAAYTAIVLVYTNLPLDWNTGVAWFILMLFMAGIFLLLRFFMRNSSLARSSGAGPSNGSGLSGLGL